MDYLSKGGTTEEWNKLKAGKKSSEANRTGLEDVTREYADTAKPGTGTIRYDDAYDKMRHADELEVASWIHNNLGGDIVLLNEAQEIGVKTPDYVWREKHWDLKTTTTAKSANSAVRHGLKQIRENPGGIILDYKNNEVSIDELYTVLQKRLSASAQFAVDIIILREGKDLIAFRYKK